MTTPTLTARLLHALKARGATEIFGIPGDFALPLFREIEREALAGVPSSCVLATGGGAYVEPATRAMLEMSCSTRW